MFGRISGFSTVFLWVRLGLSHSSSKFLRLFHFAVSLHSSCSVVVCYFMLIPVFIILLFSVIVFQPSFWWNKFLWKKPVKSMCDCIRKR